MYVLFEPQAPSSSQRFGLWIWSGSKRNECAVASRSLLFAKTPVFAVCGCEVLPLKSPWARPYAVILGGFSAIACSVRQESWLLTASCSGGALISPLPQFAFLLRPCPQWERARIVHSPGPRSFMPSCVPHFLHPHSHTQRAWAPGPLVPGGLEHICCLSHWYGACWHQRHKMAQGEQSVIPFGPHVVVCIQGQMGVFTTQHFHSPVCFHLTFAQVKWEGCLPLP